MNELLLRRVRIRDVVFGEKTEVDNSILRINRQELIRYVLEDSHLKSVEIKLAKPGEKKRIIPVKDILEPRVKGEGTSAVFPGFLGTAEPVGSGMTYVLDGVEEMVRVARRMVSEHAEVGAIVLECTNMTPYAAVIQKETGLPIFDIHTLVTFVYHAVVRKEFSGLM